jgi:hypothetical protein
MLLSLESLLLFVSSGHRWVHAAYCSDTLGWVSYFRECILRRWNVKRSVDISTSNLGKCTEACSWTLHLERVIDFLRYTTSCLLSWSAATDVFQQLMVHILYFPLNLVTQNADSINKLRLLEERYLCNRYKSNTTWYSSYMYYTLHNSIA